MTLSNKHRANKGADHTPNQDHADSRDLVLKPSEVAPPDDDSPRRLTEQPEAPIRVRKRRRRKPVPVPPPPPPPSRRGCLGYTGLFCGLSFLIVTVVFAFLFLVATLEIFDFLGSPLDNFKQVFGFDPDAEPEVVDSQIIILGIRDLALLQTASGEVQIIKQVVDSGAAPDAKLRMSYLGSVAVGIDLSLISEENIVVGSDNRLTIQLPPVQIIDCILRQPEVVSVSCTDIPLVQDCDKIRTKLQDAAYDRALEDLLIQAQENEITTLNGGQLLDVAYQNAETVVADFLAKLGHENVTFERSTATLPPSETCIP